MNNIPLQAHTTFSLPVDEHLAFTCLLTVVNTAAVSVSVEILIYALSLTSFVYIPRCRIAGSYDNSVFHFLRNHHNFSYSGYTVLYSQQQCTGVQISPHPCQCLLFSVFFVYLKSRHPNGYGVLSHCSLIDISDGDSHKISPLCHTSTSSSTLLCEVFFSQDSL